MIGGAGAFAALALTFWHSPPSDHPLEPEAVLAAYEAAKSPGGLLLRCPFNEAVYPQGIAAPAFTWDDLATGVDVWLVCLRFCDGEQPLFFEALQSEWQPSKSEWETIQQRGLAGPVQATVLGVSRQRQTQVLSSGRVSFAVSSDRVDASIFYREVNLPFREAVIDPSRIRWRFGEVTSTEPPRVVLTGLPVCGNCHSFSADGKTLGMDVDYANDKASYAILPVENQMVIDPSKIITWSDYGRDDPQPTLGLLSRISPDGKYVVSTVKDGAVFEPKADLTFSQLFFPIKGVLAIYERETGKFDSLPGADDPQYVQSNAVWSPDGKWLVFARAPRFQSSRAGLITPVERKEFLDGSKEFRFDLYRVPFNDGKGGEAKPLVGASGNGMSNYFPRYSPDGKWIVFCKAKSFMLLQPDSELYIVPSEGGEAKRLGCNTSRMNSWHSWSPNGKWMVFSSKAFTPYTQLFLTHFDGADDFSPPVLLEGFTAPDRAANIPEFVSMPSDTIQGISERFLDAHNYLRQAQVNAQFRDLDRAEAACRKAIDLDPKDPTVWTGLAGVLMSQGRTEEAADACREAIRHSPDCVEAHVMLGTFLMNAGQPADGAKHLKEAIRVRPDDASVHFYLGLAFAQQSQFDQALAEYDRALELLPDSPSTLAQAALLRATCPESSLRDPEKAIQMAQKACELTRFANAECLAILGRVYAEAGRRPDALLAYSRAAAVARQRGQHKLAAQIEGDLRVLSGGNSPLPARSR